MKKLFYILLFFLQVIVCAQQSWDKSSPLDYIWMNVGNTGFSPGNTWGESLAFSPSGQPYVAYIDIADSMKATVMTFNRTNWVNVGNEGFSAGWTQLESLAFSLSGQPYVAYEDGFDGKATVMKFDSVFVGIKVKQESRFSLYPNPATDKITVETSGTSTASYLAILNIEGQELITRQITEPKTQLDISNLPGGVYFVRLTNDKTVEVGKIIKQ
jgi:hypothetical protein